MHTTAAPDLLSRHAIVARANEIAAGLAGDDDFEPIRQLTEGADLVFGVWPDPDEPDGIATMIIKGARLLGAIVAAGKTENVKWTAVPCSCAEQAAALRLTLGDGAEVLP